MGRVVGSPSTQVAIALGSNLGDREAHLRGAVAALSPLLDELRVSRFIETDPVGVGEQPPFLNAALVGRTTLSAGELLRLLLEVEVRFGRTRSSPGAARTLDLDLIFFGDARIEEPRLSVPPSPIQRSVVRARAARRGGCLIAGPGHGPLGCGPLGPKAWDGPSVEPRLNHSSCFGIR